LSRGGTTTRARNRRRPFSHSEKMSPLDRQTREKTQSPNRGKKIVQRKISPRCDGQRKGEDADSPVLTDEID